LSHGREINPTRLARLSVKVVINKRHGGFGLSDAAYEKLIEYGVPVVAYVEGNDDGEREVIYDDDLTQDKSPLYCSMRRLRGSRYWDTWITRSNRNHPLVVRAVEELGEAADGKYAKLKVVEIPDDVQWEIDEYDGLEEVAEVHRTWG
jgi:hypothetical protein